jgi:heme oxygenase (mycobilin-producing)
LKAVFGFVWLSLEKFDLDGHNLGTVFLPGKVSHISWWAGNKIAALPPSFTIASRSTDWCLAGPPPSLINHRRPGHPALLRSLSKIMTSNPGYRYDSTELETPSAEKTKGVTPDFRWFWLVLALKPYSHMHILEPGQGGIMAIKVFIKRHTKKGRVEKAVAMLEGFRNMAKKEPGYISGETLINHYDARSITVVSTWQTIEDWISWQSSDKRAGNEAIIEELLEAPTKYEIYDINIPKENPSSDSAIIHADEVS